MRRIVVLICCCLAMAPAAARMYQWRNPATGTTQMSGAPPAWYRSGEAGPRIFVFENNQLVDDTGIAVSDAQRDALRAAAFGAASERAVVEAPRPAAQDSAAHLAPAPPAASADAGASHEATPKSAADAATSDKAASLKALIDAWDQHQLDQARSLLDMMPSDGKAAPGRR